MKDIEISDISELFTQDNANEGVWIQPTYLGKTYNFEVKVLGNDSDAVQEMSKRHLKEMRKHVQITQNGVGSIDDDLDFDALLSQNEDALVRFGGIRKLDGSPLTFKGEEIPTEKTKDSEKFYKAILNGMPDLRDFIKKQSMVRDNFLSKGKKN